MNRMLFAVAAAASILGPIGAAWAVPGVHPYVEDPKCDAHRIALGRELGHPPSGPYGSTGPFPDPEAIASNSTTAEMTVCTTSPSDPTVFDYKVTIKNPTAKSWTDPFFVADASNSFSNVDGTIDDGLAMKIDMIGVNTPPIAKSGGVIGRVFEPGEEWVFLVQDWVDFTTPGAAPHLYNSIGVAIGSPAPPSNASIVAGAITAAEPGVAGMAVLALAVMVWSGRCVPSRRIRAGRRSARHR